jgi:hypothetical protein
VFVFKPYIRTLFGLRCPTQVPRAVRQYMSSVGLLARATSYLAVNVQLLFSSFPTHHHNPTLAVEIALLVSPAFHFYHPPKHIRPSHRFFSSCCLIGYSSILKIETVPSPETLIFYKTSRLYIPEDTTHQCLKCYVMSVFVPSSGDMRN